jgi:hypothetical protein
VWGIVTGKFYRRNHHAAEKFGRKSDGGEREIDGALSCRRRIAVCEKGNRRFFDYAPRSISQ